MSTKLTKFHKSLKAYWSLLKIFLNNKKIPLIPPLYHQGNFVTNFKIKAEFFNSFFASQCSLIKNDSKLPSHLNYKTDNRLLNANFSIDDIAKILQNLYTNKVHDLQSVGHWSSFSNRLWKAVLFRLNGKKGI